MVGMIEIDASAGASLGLFPTQESRFSPISWRTNFADNAVCPAVVADLGRLRDELSDEFRRLQNRLAA